MGTEINSTFSLVAIAGTAMALSLLTVPFAKRLAVRVGLVDHPGAAAYKSHRNVTPYGGGIAIYVSCLLPAVLGLVLLYCDSEDMLFDDSGFVSPWGGPYWLMPFSDFASTVFDVSQVIVLFAGATAVWLVGMADDFRGLTPFFRFVAQLAAAATLVIWVPGFQLPIAVDVSGGVLAATITIVWITTITNAFNLLDNMNGLAAGVAAICISGWISLALAVGHLPAAVVGLLVMGSTLGFLVYNFPEASVFMGDAGGLFLGFTIGGLSVLLSGRAATMMEVNGLLPLVPLLILWVPVYDLLSVVIIRVARRVPPWHGDQNHTSHRLVRLGLSRRNSVLVLYAATLLTVSATLLVVSSGKFTVSLLSAMLPVLAALAFADRVMFRRETPL